MHLGNPPRERQPQAEAVGGLTPRMGRPGPIEAVEGREHALALGGRDPVPLVRHGESHVVAVVPGRKRDRRRAVLGGVLDQVPEGPLDEGGNLEVFRAAILGGAAHVIIVHNHPSGDPAPSKEDVHLTRQLIPWGGERPRRAIVTVQAFSGPSEFDGRSGPRQE